MPLPCYTDEILDSMLSLRRFTSLVRWRYVGESYRPVRSANSPVDMALVSSQDGLPTNEQLYADDDWLWTAASDRRFTVGWIVRDYDYDNRPLWDYTANPLDESGRPWLKIRGLDTTGGELEFVWFDDQRGVIVEKLSPLSVSGGQATIRLPETEPAPIGGFGKSIAFLIQPVGYTPDCRFAELPNELIGQIDVQNAYEWHAERPIVNSGQSYIYFARTRPEIPVPERANYYYRWTFPPGSVIAGYGMDTVSRSISGETEERKQVKVDIEDRNGKRVSGDIIRVILR